MSPVFSGDLGSRLLSVGMTNRLHHGTVESSIPITSHGREGLHIERQSSLVDPTIEVLPTTSNCRLAV